MSLCDGILHHTHFRAFNYQVFTLGTMYSCVLRELDKVYPFQWLCEYWIQFLAGYAFVYITICLPSLFWFITYRLGQSGKIQYVWT